MLIFYNRAKSLSNDSYAQVAIKNAFPSGKALKVPKNRFKTQAEVL